MAGGVTFDEKSAMRIIEGIRKVEGLRNGQHTAPGKSPRMPRTRGLLINAIVTTAASAVSDWDDGTQVQTGEAELIAKVKNGSNYEYSHTGVIVDFVNDDTVDGLAVGDKIKLLPDANGLYSVVWMLCN